MMLAADFIRDHNLMAYVLWLVRRRCCLLFWFHHFWIAYHQDRRRLALAQRRKAMISKCDVDFQDRAA